MLYLYPAEVLNYPIRANGMGIFQFWLNGTALLFVFVMPIALQNISWKIYMINGAWDIVVFFIILVWWVETKGKTIEEVDACFDGKKTDVPDLMAIEKGKEDIEGIITAVPANEVVASEDKRD